MNDFNFDKMKSFDISDEWADRVLSTASKIKPRPKYNAKIIASCLCLTFVCMISVLVFGFGKTQPQIPTAPKETETVIQTQEKSENKAYKTVKKQEKSEVTQVKETKNQEISASKQEESTKKPTDKKEQKPTVLNNHTQKPVIKPTVKPVKPTNETVSEETQPSTEQSLPNKEESTEESKTDNEDLTSPTGSDCIVSFSPSYLVGDGKIYCRIKDVNDRPVGDRKLFSSEHLARFYSGFGSVYYYIYSPQSVGLVLEPGTYRYYFYNEHGVPITDVIVEIK